MLRFIGLKAKYSGTSIKDKEKFPLNRVSLCEALIFPRQKFVFP